MCSVLKAFIHEVINHRLFISGGGFQRWLPSRASLQLSHRDVILTPLSRAVRWEIQPIAAATRREDEYVNFKSRSEIKFHQVKKKNHWNFLSASGAFKPIWGEHDLPETAITQVRWWKYPVTIHSSADVWKQEAQANHLISAVWLRCSFEPSRHWSRG